MAASVEEVSYELGGALGVTLMGSILSGVYAQSLDVPVGVAASPARDSLDEALIVADQLSAELEAPWRSWRAPRSTRAMPPCWPAARRCCWRGGRRAAERPRGGLTASRPGTAPARASHAPRPAARPSATPSRILAPINARFKAPATSSSACAP